MEEEIIQVGIDKWHGIVINHTIDAVINASHNNNQYTSSPFSIYMGKMLECIYYEKYKDLSTAPNFDLDGYDGGVDLKIDNQNVSIKLRSLPHAKDVYQNEDLFLFNRQYDMSKEIIKKLIADNTCRYILGAIKYDTNLFYDWCYNWEIQDYNTIKEISFEIFNTQCLWFSTKYGNIEIHG